MINIRALLVATFVLAAVAVPPAGAASRSQSCQTINDWTICVRGSGAGSAVSLSCRTVDGHTACRGPGGLRCEAAGGRPVCRGGGAGFEVEILPANPRTGTMPSLDDLEQDEED
jgi:hypothetical protein